MEGSKSKKTRIIIVNKSFQLKIISLFFIHSVCTSIIFAIVSYFYFSELFNLGNQIDLTAQHPLMIWINEQNLGHTRALLFAGFIVTSISTLFAVALSHRIAGPLYRLTKTMIAFAKGEKVSKINFRKNDFFEELAVAFNNIIDEQNKEEESHLTDLPSNVIPLKNENEHKKAA